MKRNLVLSGFDNLRAEELIHAAEFVSPNKYAFVTVRSLSEIERLEGDGAKIVVVFAEMDSVDTRKYLWWIKSNYPDLPIIICSLDQTLASLAWQAGAMFFITFPLSRRSVAMMLQKVEEKLNAPFPRIKLSYQNGFEVVSAEDICLCEGDGNYTTIFLRNSKKVIMSKKLKDIYVKLTPFPELVRIGKSYIINISNIVRVDDQEVHFRGNKENIRYTFSPMYLKRLKENMLWYSV